MRQQCRKCPWRRDVDPRDIPNGYSVERHCALRRTIAEEGRVAPRLHVMACHETPVGDESPCVGWLHHQLGPGNNIALRLAVSAGRISADYEIVGEQHDTFDETLPPPC